MKDKVFLFIARFAETIGLGLFVNALYSFQTSGATRSAFIVMVEGVLIIPTSILCYVIMSRK